MKIEAWIFGGLAIFFALVTPVYWFMSGDLTGTTALILTFLLVMMLAAYLALIARRIDPRPEDKKEGEIAEGAGELGFFPPQSIWPLFCAVAFGLLVLAPVFGWWLALLAVGFGTITLTGWIYEFYRGDYAH
ncbi:MAG: cytochrome c oxidase subunit 4 [Actinomycetes bacterium]